MSDVSGNDSKTIEQSHDNVNEDSENEGYQTIVIQNTVDYSSYFENLQAIGLFISALLVAYALAFAFFKGFRK